MKTVLASIVNPETFLRHFSVPPDPGWKPLPWTTLIQSVLAIFVTLKCMLVLGLSHFFVKDPDTVKIDPQKVTVFQAHICRGRYGT